VYSGFWHLVGAAVKARYHELLSYEPDYGAIYTGVEKFLYMARGAHTAPECRRFLESW